MTNRSIDILIDPGSAITAEPTLDRLRIRDGRFVDAHAAAEKPDAELDLRGLRVLPGMIDIHLHGGRGVSFEQSAEAAAMREHALWLARHGVTGYLRSISAPDHQALLALVRQHVRQMKSHQGGALPMGLHLEGPWLNPEKAGAFDTSWLRLPDLDEVRELLEAGEGWIKIVTLAPELPGASELAAFLRQSGVVCALGHSAASYELAAQALAGDFSHVTHTFNAQSAFNHRAPGVVGAVLTSEQVTAEVIADGQHVHPGGLRLLLRSLGAERLVLVSDASVAAGMPDGSYHLAGHTMRVTDGVARLDDGTLAGSTVTLDTCLKVMIDSAGASLEDAARMAAGNPARVLGIDQHQGSLQPGRYANLTALNGSGQVVLTMIRGEIAFNIL